MQQYAAVIVDISHESVDRPFSYKIPEELTGEVKIGSCVKVPFGKGNKLINGYVVELTDHVSLPDEKLKNLAPALIITCGQDTLKPQADAYKIRLENAGVTVQLFDYPESVHGFLECNYPETEDSNSAKSPEQAAQCVLAQTTIEEALLKIWSEQ